MVDGLDYQYVSQPHSWLAEVFSSHYNITLSGGRPEQLNYKFILATLTIQLLSYSEHIFSQSVSPIADTLLRSFILLIKLPHRHSNLPIQPISTRLLRNRHKRTIRPSPQRQTQPRPFLTYRLHIPQRNIPLRRQPFAFNQHYPRVC